MTSVSGSRTNAIYKIGGTFGTAVSGGAGNKLRSEITPNFNVDVLKPRQIGTGNLIALSATRGNLKPTLQLAMDAGYRNCMDFILAQFFGTASAPAEQTASQGDYKHTLTLNPTLNAKWGTLAYDTSNATLHEYPSTACQSITISLDDAPGILNFEAELLANNIVLTGAVNTNASMASATITDTETINYAFDDTFRINNNTGGALSGSDQYNITGFSFNFQRPQSIKGEIKGSAGNGAPVEEGIILGTLTVNVKELADHAMFTDWSAETPKKCSLNIQGTQIGSGVNKAITINIPKMQLVQEPKYALTSEGVNPLTLTFEILGATANPTGMTSFYPYIEIINNYGTNLLT